MIKIHSNGSKWPGEPLDTVEDLLQVLSEYPLDPLFEKYGNFIHRLDDPDHGLMTAELRAAAYGQIRFHGNFKGISHVFSIDTDEPELIATLTEAIRNNQASPAYLEIKAQAKEAKKQAEEERRQREEARKLQQIAELKARLAALEA